MCECGCTTNDKRYTFPGPGNSFYLLTLTRGCKSCDGPSGVSIEHIKPGMFLYSKKHREYFVNGKLKFEKWPDSEGVAIITGFLQHEFVKAIAPYLVDTKLDELDQIGAEVLLEEAYEDSVVEPHFPKSSVDGQNNA